MAKSYVSYSEMRAFYWSKDEWYESYIKGKEFETNINVEIGSAVHNWMDDSRFPINKTLLELGVGRRRIFKIRKMLNKAYSKKGKERECPAWAERKDGIKLFGLYDGFDRDSRVLKEYKTSPNADKVWSQSRADKDEQLSFYAMIYRLTFHSYFKEIQLVAMDTTRGNCKVFYTARGPKDIEYVEERLNNFIRIVKKEGLWLKRLSRKERMLLTNGKLF